MADKNFEHDVSAFNDKLDNKLICEKGTAQSRAQQALAQAEMAKEHAAYRIDQAGFATKARIEEASLEAKERIDEHSRRLMANLASNSSLPPCSDVRQTTAGLAHQQQGMIPPHPDLVQTQTAVIEPQPAVRYM